MNPSISAALQTPCSEGKEAQTWLSSSDPSHPLHHHSSSNLCRTPTPAQLRESNNSGYFTSKLKKADIIPCTTADQEKCMESTGSKAAHLLEAEQGTSGWCHRKFVTNTGGGTEPPTAYKGHSSAAHTPPKLGRGTWLFISACFFIFRSVWENYICDPSTERTPNLSPDVKL